MERERERLRESREVRSKRREREAAAPENPRSARKRKLTDKEEGGSASAECSPPAAGGRASGGDAGGIDEVQDDGPPICKRTRSSRSLGKEERAATVSSSRKDGVHHSSHHHGHGKEAARDNGKEAKESGKDDKKERESGGGSKERDSRSRKRPSDKDLAGAPSLLPSTAASGAAAAGGAASSLASDMGSIFGSSVEQRMAAGSLGDAFNGLRRILGSGFDDLPFGIRSSNSKFKSLIDGLKADGNLPRQIESLKELCELLCMATEDSLSGFSVECFLPLLVALVSNESCPEVMLLACRAIAYMLESIPGSSAAVVHFGCIPPLCAKLMTIDYIDVAEQALLTLHKISADHAGQVLRAGGMTAVLTYLDFFPISVQRTGMATAANMCKRVTADCVNLAFCRLVANLQSHPTHLESLAAHDLIPNTWLILSQSFNASASSDVQTLALSNELLSQLLSMLATLASSCPSLSLTILRQNEIGAVLRSRILSGRLDDESLAASRRRSSVETMRNASSTPELLRSVVLLIKSLLPALPRLPPVEAKTPSPSKGSTRKGKSSGGGAGRSSSRVSQSSSRTGTPAAPAVLGEGDMVWKDNEELFEKFAEQLVSAVLTTALTSIDSNVRMDSLQALCRLSHYMNPTRLEQVLDRSQVCELLSALLSTETAAARNMALTLVHVHMTKAPEVMRPLLTREGIVYQIQNIAHSYDSAAGGGGGAAAGAGAGGSSTAGSSRWSTGGGTESNLEAMIKFVCATHLPRAGEEGVDEDGLTHVVRELQGLSTQLAGEVDDDDAFVSTLEKILHRFADRDTVSTFEMQRSGVCHALANGLANVSERRWDAFVKLATTPHRSEGDGMVSSPAGELLLKLVAALNNAEGFEMGGVGDAAGGAPSDVKGNVTRLSVPQAVRLKFQRLGLTTDLKDYPNEVMIDPLAPMSAVHDFLLPRVVRSSASFTASGSGNKPRSSDGAAGAGGGAGGGGGSASSPARKSSPTRNSTQARAAAALEQARARASRRAGGRASSRALLEGDSDEEDDIVGVVGGLMADEDEDVDEEMMEEVDEEMVDGDDDGAHEAMHFRSHQVLDIDLKCNSSGSTSGHALDSALAPQAGTQQAGASSSSGASSRGRSRRGGDGGGGEEGSSSSSSSAPLRVPQSGLRLSIYGVEIAEDTPVIEGLLMAHAAHARAQASSSSSAASSSTAIPPPQVSATRSSTDLWGSVHIVEYDLASAASASANANNSKGTAGEPKKDPAAECHAWASRMWTKCRAAAVLCAEGSGAPPGGGGGGGGRAFGGGLDALEAPESTLDMLRLCKMLYAINEGLDDERRVGAHALVVGNLCRKASSAAGDPVALCTGKEPAWLRTIMRECPFLLSYDVRKKFFQMQAYGLTRALRLQAKDGERAGGAGQGSRQKVRVGRKRMIESARKVMDMYTQVQVPRSSTLEVEFYGEVGVGAGPTQEFFSCVCHEIARKELSLWWDADVDSGADFVAAAHGLFPAPLPPAGSERADDIRKKRVDVFEVIGWVCGKALQDGRLLDLPLSLPLCRAIVGCPLEVEDLRFVCPNVYQTFVSLSELARRKAAIAADTSINDGERASRMAGLTLDGAELSSLGIVFVVPGYEEVELKQGGGDVALTVDNVEEYVELLPKVVLTEAVMPLLCALRDGIKKVIPIESLSVFCVDEVQHMFASDDKHMDWSPESLLQAFKFEHGYTCNSRIARLLTDVLSNLPLEHKRKFVSFCTGCPRLPAGGFSSLRPCFTVVRKESSRAPIEQQLPSVMTCANYLKLPEYDTAEVLRDRLLVAVNEADGSFHLS